VGQIIEYTLVSADGVFSGDRFLDLMTYRDDAYLRDRLGVLSSSEAMLYGRTVYDSFAERWTGRDHPWATRLTSIPKYVFSSTIEEACWGPTTIIRGDPVSEARRLKEQTAGDLLIFGHTRLAETLMRAGLVDTVDMSIHPVFFGCGGLLMREGLGGRARAGLHESILKDRQTELSGVQASIAIGASHNA
jgi:dihydrofolate reductase